MKPIFLFTKRFPPGKFRGITFLIFVITKTTNGKPVELSGVYKRHETYHVWQQLTLFVTGLIVAAAFYLFGEYSPWLWAIPVLMPFVVYVLCWLIELALPPYVTAYKDICFEGEALYNERNPKPRFVPFSFLRYIKNKDWRRLGEERFK